MCEIFLCFFKIFFGVIISSSFYFNRVSCGVSYFYLTFSFLYIPFGYCYCCRYALAPAYNGNFMKYSQNTTTSICHFDPMTEFSRSYIILYDTACYTLTVNYWYMFVSITIGWNHIMISYNFWLLLEHTIWRRGRRTHIVIKVHTKGSCNIMQFISESAPKTTAP